MVLTVGPNVPTTDPALLTSCTPSTCSIYTSFYNYRVAFAANLTFVILFSLLLVIYPTIWIFTRRGHFFTIMMTTGIVTEIIGYAARVWSYYSPWNETAFMMQICCLTLAPAFLTAAIYVCLGDVVIIYGKSISRLKPYWYTFIFVPCDAVALLLQAIGGGIAAASLGETDLDGINTGDYIMTAGLSFQVFTLFCFLYLCGEFAFRVRRRRRQLGDEQALSQDPLHVAARQSSMFHQFLFALALATLLIFWRCCFRVAELNDGFSGPITFHQGLFIGFEGVLVVVAVIVLAIWHPAICMGEAMRHKGRRQDQDNAEMGESPDGLLMNWYRSYSRRRNRS